MFVDNTAQGTADASDLTTVAAEHDLIFGRGGQAHIGHGYGYCPEALTDTEITEDLPTLLEFE